VVSFTPRPLYPQGKIPWYPLDRRLGRPQSRSGRGGEEKNSQPPPGNLVSAVTSRKIIPHQRLLIVIYDIVSLINSTLFTADIISLCTKKACPYIMISSPIFIEKYINVCWLTTILNLSDLL
jgi:hypothetical protein